MAIITPPAAVPASEATRAPRATDDTTLGYSVGSNWQLGGRLWNAKRVTSANAVWRNDYNNADQNPGLLGDVCASIGTVVAAYGMSRLFAAYAGNCCTITRASDSTTKAIGFINNLPDFATGDAFVLGTTGGVSTWNDQSGNTRNATQATQANMPSWSKSILQNGSRSLNLSTFGYTAQTLSLPAGVSIGTQNFTCILIGSLKSGAVQSNLISLNTGNGGTIAANGDAVNNYYGFGMYNSSWKPLGIPTSTPSCLVVTGSASALTAYQNDFTLGTTSAFGSTTWASGTIGQGALGNGCSFDYLACIVMTGVPTSAQLAQIMQAAYLQFNLFPQLKNRVVVCGDSICFGQNALVNGATGNLSGVNWVRSMQAALLPYQADVVNMGTPSQTMQAIAANATQYFQGAAIAGKTNICIFESSINDLYVNSRTPAQCYADLTTAVSAARANGYQYVGATTTLPKSGFSETVRGQYIALLKSNATPLDFLLDFGSDADMGASSAPSNANLFYSDGTHPTPLGHSYLGQIAAKAVLPLLKVV